jgi:DNA-binding CsgD family transcriptional regulator
MSRDIDIETLVELIYDAALDNELWPCVLARLADLMSVPQVAMPSFDRRANLFATIAPRMDPDLIASYKDYWAFHDPVLAQAILRPAGQIYAVERLMPREEFAATPVFNEFWRPAQLGLETTGASLLVEDQLSALICFSNVPGKDLTAEQMHIFEAVLPHLTRAVRISRQLWYSQLKDVVATERLETPQQGALLADVSARVTCANTTAMAMLDDGGGIFLENGRLSAAGRSEALRKAIASCARTSPSVDGPGGEFEFPRELPNAPIHVTVAPLRSNTRLTEVPWIGCGAPVAIVMISDPDMDRRRQKINLRCRFGFTEAESGVAMEILKGDGRRAAACRLGISETTAKSHLGSIFEKTGTHRQAELVRLLLDAANAQETEISPSCPQ